MLNHDKINYSDSDILLCEKMVNEFQNYKLVYFSHNAFVRILYIDNLGFYPHLIFGSHEFNDSMKIKESLQKDFEGLDFINKYDASRPVIIINVCISGIKPSERSSSISSWV